MVGFLVALTMMFCGPWASIPAILLLSLWPTSIVGFGFNGPGFSAIGVLVAFIELACNAAVYAALAAILSGGILAARGAFTKKQQPTSSIKPERSIRPPHLRMIPSKDNPNDPEQR
jgi:hypothetical protein